MTDQTKQRHLHVVRPLTPETAKAIDVSTAPAVAGPSMRQRPPLRPLRPSSAVRKSMRLLLAQSELMLAHTGSADARFASRSNKAADALHRYGLRVAALADELRHACECEHRHYLWRQGRRYVE